MNVIYRFIVRFGFQCAYNFNSNNFCRVCVSARLFFILCIDSRRCASNHRFKCVLIHEANVNKISRFKCFHQDDHYCNKWKSNLSTNCVQTSFLSVPLFLRLPSNIGSDDAAATTAAAAVDAAVTCCFFFYSSAAYLTQYRVHKTPCTM